MVRFDRRELKFGDETVKFIYHQDGSKSVEPSLAQHRDSLSREIEILFHARVETVIILTWVQTPSTTSTRTRAPSHTRDAVDTSLEKSTCPGVSIMFTT